MENLKKFLTQEGKEKDFESISGPVKAHWCKTEASTLLNKIVVVQAFYNNVNLGSLTLPKDPKTGQPQVCTAADRKLVAK